MNDIEKLIGFLKGNFTGNDPESAVNNIKKSLEDPKSAELLDIITELVSRASDLGCLTGVASVGTFMEYERHQDMTAVSRAVIMLLRNNISPLLIMKLLMDFNIPLNSSMVNALREARNELSNDDSDTTSLEEIDSLINDLP